MEREEQKKDKSMIIVALLCAALFGIAVAYAALSTTLNITFTTLQQEGLTWNVGFKTGNYSATASGSSSVSCGEAVVTSNTTTVGNTVLSTLHDKCVYALQIQNTGSVAAVLDSITAKTPTSTSCDTSTTSSMVCGNTTYKLTTDAAGQNLLAENTTLAATTGTLDVYLTVEYTGESTGGSNVNQSNGGFTLNYVQQ